MSTTLSRISDRIIAFRRQYIFTVSMDDPAFSSRDYRVPEGLAISVPLHPSDLARLEFDGGAAERDAIRAFIQNGEMLGVVMAGDRVVGRGLVRSKGRLSLEGHLRARRLAPGQRFIHHCRTSPDFQGQGLYPALLTEMLRVLRQDDDVDEVLISCNRSNIPSIKGIARAGFELSERTTTIGIGGGRLGFTWYQLSPH